MKLNCQECGHDNELGRIFCGKCGKKLDMSQISREAVFRERGNLSFGRIVKWLMLFIVVVAVIAAGLALWARDPLREPSRADQRRIGAHNVRGRLGGVRSALSVGGETSLTLAADDVNDFLETYYGDRLLSISARMTSGSMVIRVVDEHVWTVFDYDIGPLAYSYEVRCVPTADGFRITGAAIGRLPLPGPLASPVNRRMADVFENADLEKELLQNLSALEFEPDLIKAAFGP